MDDDSSLVPLPLPLPIELIDDVFDDLTDVEEDDIFSVLNAEKIETVNPDSGIIG